MPARPSRIARISAAPAGAVALPLALLMIAAATPGAAAALRAATWEEARALSREHGKPVLIDFFTEW